MIRRIAPLLLALLLVLSACTSGSETDSEPSATGTVEDTESASVPAPEFPAGVDWLNTERALTMSDLEGKVVLLDFWTYGCINCIHIIPDLERLEAEFADELVVIGVHSAKFDAESNTENIRQIILRYGIEHPVVNDPDFVIWNSWGARAWPTVFVVDPVGGVVGLHAGEGVYDVVQPVITGLIEEFEAVLDRAPLALQLEADGAPRTVLSYPGKVLADEDNDRLFIADTNHHRVLEARISDGQVMAAYGSGRAGFVDGPASGAEFHAPQGLALEPGGDSLLVADTDNHLVRSIDLVTGEVTTVAGTGRQAGYPPRGGSAAATDLSSPWDLAVASDGALYVAMAGTHQIWRFDHVSGVIEPYVGSAGEGTSNSTLALSELAQPSGLAIDDLGRIFFADSESSSIRVADPSADSVALVAGGRQTLFEFGDVDGVGDEARFQHPLGVAFADGYLWVADTYNSKIKRIDPESGTATTLAGAGPGWSDGLEPRFYEPGGLSTGAGVLYVADTNNHSIRVVDTSTGATSTLVLKGAEEFLPAAGEDLFAGTVVESNQITVGIGAVDVVLRIEIPDGFKVNPDAPSRFDFTIDGTAASVESPGVVIDPSFPLTILGGVAQDTTELIGDVAVVYCEAEQESICLIEQVRFVVPVQPVTDGPATIELEHTIELPEL